MDKITIYGLYDPITGELRYVGQAQYLEKRYKQHLAEARYGHSGKCNDWVRSLQSEGKAPDVNILITCDRQHANVLEHRLIRRFVTAGYGLLNTRVAAKSKMYPSLALIK